ncbi:MAG: hypothetical protein ACTHU0_35025 [Kofleriaceae bacterium]
MDAHFIFHGEPAQRDAARARVGRALEHLAATNRDPRVPRITSLDDHLKDHYVEVTPDGATLRVVTNPAQRPTWDMTFEVSPDDTATDIVIGEDAEPPP